MFNITKKVVNYSVENNKNSNSCLNDEELLTHDSLSRGKYQQYKFIN